MDNITFTIYILIQLLQENSTLHNIITRALGNSYYFIININCGTNIRYFNQLFHFMFQVNRQTERQEGTGEKGAIQTSQSSCQKGWRETAGLWLVSTSQVSRSWHQEWDWWWHHVQDVIQCTSSSSGLLQTSHGEGTRHEGMKIRKNCLRRR